MVNVNLKKAKTKVKHKEKESLASFLSILRPIVKNKYQTKISQNQQDTIDICQIATTLQEFNIYLKLIYQTKTDVDLIDLSKWFYLSCCSQCSTTLYHSIVKSKSL